MDEKEENQDGEEEQTEVEKQNVKIAEMEESLLLAKELNISLQIDAYIEEIDLATREKKAIVRGYRRAFFRDGEMSRYSIDDYSPSIPLHGLKALKEAIIHEIYSNYEIWEDSDDNPIMVGKLSANHSRSYFLIADW